MHSPFMLPIIYGITLYKHETPVRHDATGNLQNAWQNEKAKYSIDMIDMRPNQGYDGGSLSAACIDDGFRT